MNKNISLERKTKTVDVYNQKNIPVLRFPEFCGEWNEFKLKNLAKIQRGASPRPISDKKWYDFDNKNVGWVRIGDVTNSSKFLYKTEDYFSKEGVKKSRFLPKGSLIMSICATIGKPIITSIDTCIHDGFVGFTNLNNTTNEFMYYILKILEKRFISLSQTGTQANLNTDLINNTKVRIPSIDEQRKITQFISVIDKKIDLMEKKHQDLLIYQKETRTKILNNDYYNLYEIHLKDLSKINKGKQLNKTDMEDYGKYYVLNGGKNPSGYTNSWNVAKNTISISEGGNSCGFIKFNKDNFYCGGHCFYLTLTSDLIKNELLYHCLKENQNQIMKLRVGTGLPNIQKKDLENFKFNIPLRNQQEITNLFNNINYNITLIHNNIHNLKKYKKGLLQKMFC